MTDRPNPPQAVDPRPSDAPREHSRGPALPDARMHLHTPASPCRGVLVASERCTVGQENPSRPAAHTSSKAAGFVRHVAFDVSGTRLAGNFLPGQSFGVIPPGADARGQPHKLRLYSIASPSFGEDGQGRVIATTVKRLIDEHHETGRLFLGVASNYLCDLAVGESATLTGPSGKRFLLPSRPEDHDYVFFATGTGIAPFRGMLLELFRHPVRPPTRSRVVLVMGSPYHTDLMYGPLLRELAAAHTNFTYLTAISRERQADGSGPMYVQDRVLDRGSPIPEVLRSDRGLVYICGVAGMELGILRALAAALPGPLLDPYVQVDPECRAAPRAWDRRMLHKQVRPTRRVFLEVY